MRRESFDVTIYQIEFTSESGTWYVCADHVLDDEPKRLFQSPNSVTNGFHESGQCWQMTGIRGTFDLEYARRCLARVRERDDKGWQYRIVRRSIKQTLEVLVEEHWA